MLHMCDQHLTPIMCYLEEACATCRQSGLKNNTFDLRYNLGGLLDEAVKAASYFPPDNTLVVTEDLKT